MVNTGTRSHHLSCQGEEDTAGRGEEGGVGGRECVEVPASTTVLEKVYGYRG